MGKIRARQSKQAFENIQTILASNASIMPFNPVPNTDSEALFKQLVNLDNPTQKALKQAEQLFEKKFEKSGLNQNFVTKEEALESLAKLFPKNKYSDFEHILDRQLHSLYHSRDILTNGIEYYYQQAKKKDPLDAQATELRIINADLNTLINKTNDLLAKINNALDQTYGRKIDDNSNFLKLFVK